MAACVCSLKFLTCALGSAEVCYRYSLFPDTVEGRRAAKAVNGQVMPDENEFLTKMRAIRELAKERAA